MNHKVAVVATVLNERATLDAFVDSLLAQTRPPDELVIVDGGSDDGTFERLVELQRLHANILVHQAPGTNIAQGRNVGIARASAPLIAVTDAGTSAAPTWLAELVRPLEDPSIDVSAGFFEPGGTSFFERCLSSAITPQLPEVDPVSFLPSSRSVAFRKDCWERVGGYPEWLEHCEDLVFDLALIEHGATFAFSPHATVMWRTRSSMRQYFRQYFLYARGDGHAGLWPRRHAVRYGAYATGALLLAFGYRNHAAVAVLALGLSAYHRKFHRRVLRRPPADTPLTRVAAHLLVPVIVTTGDVAKMLGYPVGRWQRRDVRRTQPAAQRSSASAGPSW